MKVKNISYVPYTPFLCVPGTHIKIAEAVWTCLASCTVIGHTVIDQLPVLKDGVEPRINSGELVKGQYVVKDGQVAVEFEILEAFKKVDLKDLEDLVGKTIKVSSFVDDTLILVFDDQTYIKVKSGHEYEDLILVTENITMEDLRRLDLVKKTDWDCYLLQQEFRSETLTQRSGRRQLANAVSILGHDKVQRILKE